MKQQTIRRALKTVAKNHQMSQKQLTRELDELIADTLSALSKTGNAQALAAWQDIPKEEAVPTAEELICYLARQMPGNNEFNF